MSHEPEKPELPSDDEIEARFQKIRENLHPDLEDVDLQLAGILDNTKADRIEDDEHAAYHAKLDDIDAKLAKAKQAKDVATNKAKDTSISGSLDQKGSLSMGLGLSMAYTIIGAPILGYLAGLGINKLTGTQGWQIWLTLLGSIIGIGWVATVTNRNQDRL